MAVRTIACLPALTGAWRDAGGGVLLSTSGTFPVDNARSSGPDLIRPGTRTLNMSQLGRILRRPVARSAGEGALRLQLQPGGGRARAGEGAPRPRARGPVHGRARAVPDRHRRLRRHRAARDDDARALRHPQGVRPPLRQPEPARDRAARRGKPNTELFRLLAARMGLDHPASATATSRWRARRFRWDHPFWRGSATSGSSARHRCASTVPDPLRAVRRGRLPDAVGQVRALLDRARGSGARPPCRLRPAARGADQRSDARRALPARLHLAARAPLPELDLLGPAGVRAARRRADLTIHPDDAARRAASTTARW